MAKEQLLPINTNSESRNVTTLNFDSSYISSAELFDIVKKSPNLTHLSFEYCSNITANQILKCIEELTKLEYLKVPSQSSPFTKEDIEIINKLRLRHLNLINLVNVTVEEYRAILENVNVSTELTLNIGTSSLFYEEINNKLEDRRRKQDLENKGSSSSVPETKTGEPGRPTTAQTPILVTSAVAPASGNRINPSNVPSSSYCQSIIEEESSRNQPNQHQPG